MAGERAAIVTAAGASTRMSVHKALLPWRGEPLVAHQVRTLCEASFDAIVVVTGARSAAVAAATPREARVVRNDDWATGRSGSIATGAGALPDDPGAIVVTAVDQPLVARVLDRLLRDAGAPVVQPLDPDRGPEHPVVLGGEQIDALRSIEEEPEGLRSLVRRLRTDGVLVEFDDLPCWNLNTPEAYRRARVRAGLDPSPT